MKFHRTTKKYLLAGIISLSVFPIEIVIGNTPAAGNATTSSSPSAIRVLTTTPKAAAEQIVTVEQPAEVAAYYQVPLIPRVAGTIKSVEKSLGDKVTSGEILVQIDTGDASGIATSMNAPFDGVVSARTADPGLFVASAAVVPGVDALLTVDRTDIVTISMAVPESYVTYLTKETQAEISMDAIPGRILRSRLSRVAPSMNAGDRTLRVEVDLFNGTADDFSKFVAKADANGRSDLKSRTMPFFPEGLPRGTSAGLLPGMYGKMKLTMRSQQAQHLVPSNAIVREGGMPYLFKNENGIARRSPIEIQMDDGTFAGVRWTVTQDLSPTDEIIISNQGELQDGTPIQATPSK